MILMYILGYKNLLSVQIFQLFFCVPESAYLKRKYRHNVAVHNSTSDIVLNLIGTQIACFARIYT